MKKWKKRKHTKQVSTLHSTVTLENTKPRTESVKFTPPLAYLALRSIEHVALDAAWRNNCRNYATRDKIT